MEKTKVALTWGLLQAGWRANLELCTSMQLQFIDNFGYLGAFRMQSLKPPNT